MKLKDIQYESTLEYQKKVQYGVWQMKELEANVERARKEITRAVKRFFEYKKQLDTLKNTDPKDIELPTSHGPGRAIWEL